jgi:hypothetical protein
MFMYIPVDAGEPLSQGDICRDIPLPLMSHTTQIVDIKASSVLNQSVPSEEMLATRSQIAALVSMVRSHVVVLSQSCDLTDAETKPNARILVAPTMPDDDDRFANVYAASMKNSAEALVKKLVLAAKSGNSSAQVGKSKESLEKTRRKALEDLWLGKLEGAMPLAARLECGLQRSICFFDNAVSLPATWLPLLKKQRVVRLNVEWADVLREKLASWIGRFAFPGSKNERLAVGGLASEASVDASDEATATE